MYEEPYRWVGSIGNRRMGETQVTSYRESKVVSHV